jgi:hypothetical protein
MHSRQLITQKEKGIIMQNSQYVLAEKMVDAIHGALGFHPNYRALHATGQFYRGTFKATPDAKQYTRAVHLQGDPVPVTLRFSLGGGNPDSPPAKTVGMAAKFYLPDGRVTDLVMLNAPTFFIRKPDELMGFAEAVAPVPGTNKPDKVKLQAFLAAHPATACATKCQRPSVSQERASTGFTRSALSIPGKLRAMRSTTGTLTTGLRGSRLRSCKSTPMITCLTKWQTVSNVRR